MRVTRQGLSDHGFTLIEVVIVIIIVGVIASVATMKLSETVQTAEYEQTKKELDALAVAVTGDPHAYASGAQADFGYVGDVGALPPDLDALVANPGGFSTWKGPYIESGAKAGDFKQDAWGVAYVYLDTLLRSTGSGANIDKLIASTKSDLFNNTVDGVITDASIAAPGAIYKDSVVLQLIYPDGAGALKIDSTRPSRSGAFSFSNIPIGHQTLRVIYRPETDTLVLAVTVYPRKVAKVSVIFPADLW